MNAATNKRNHNDDDDEEDQDKKDPREPAATMALITSFFVAAGHTLDFFERLIRPTCAEMLGCPLGHPLQQTSNEPHAPSRA
ncbi:hypothetical protein GCM10027418_08470 [Mariniluteicoccus endophyticus]